MRTIIFSLLCLFGLVTVATAQHAIAPDPIWYPGYVICGHQDYPNYDPYMQNGGCGWSDPHQQTAITFSRSSGYIPGWAFVGYNGTQPDSVRVSYTDAHGVFHDLAVTVYRSLYRPDVRDAYVGVFPNVTNYEGYAIYFNDPSAVPLGTFTFHVQQFANNGTLQMTDNFTLNVVE